MRRAESLEKALMLGKMEGERRRGWQNWNNNNLKKKNTKQNKATKLKGNYKLSNFWHQCFQNPILENPIMELANKGALLFVNHSPSILKYNIVEWVSS